MLIPNKQHTRILILKSTTAHTSHPGYMKPARGVVLVTFLIVVVLVIYIHH